MWPFPDYAPPSQLLSRKEKENPWKKKKSSLFALKPALETSLLNGSLLLTHSSTLRSALPQLCLSSTSISPLTESPDSVICCTFRRIFTDPPYWLEANWVLLYMRQLLQEVIWTKWSNSYLIYYHSRFVQRRWKSFYPAGTSIWTKQGPKYPLRCTGVAPRGSRCVLACARVSGVCMCLPVRPR